MAIGTEITLASRALALASFARLQDAIPTHWLQLRQVWALGLGHVVQPAANVLLTKILVELEVAIQGALARIHDAASRALAKLQGVVRIQVVAHLMGKRLPGQHRVLNLPNVITWKPSQTAIPIAGVPIARHLIREASRADVSAASSPGACEAIVEEVPQAEVGLRGVSELVELGGDVHVAGGSLVPSKHRSRICNVDLMN
mmetsp:Transcript_52180/g.132696  ORF Transcript_52180/g.132696 Transcript_52180/m.132696 type:complete len:201 (-) Transcript_52180:293-895(-)